MQGNLAGLRQYLARTRSECDWQDRLFMLGLVAPSVRLAALDFACETESEAADLFLIRCAFFSDLAATMRGTGTADQIADERFRSSAECIQAALAALEKTAELDPEDPTAYAFVLPSLSIFGQLMPWQQRAFQRATELAPDLVPAYRAIVTGLSERWHGSHEKSLQFARHAITKAGPGSDMAVCLFWAHLLVRSHFSGFDKNREAAESYVHNPEVAAELDAAFDEWTQPPHSPRRSSILYFHYAACWYYLSGDRERLQRALSLTSNVFSEIPWSLIGNAQEIYSHALQVAAGETPPPQRRKSDPWELCIAAIANCADAMQGGKFALAEKSLNLALQLAQSAPPEHGSPLFPLVLFNMSWLRLKQHRGKESKKLRRQAAALLDAGSFQMASAKLQRYMAHVLNRLGDYRRAIPFWEQAIRLAGEEIDPPMMAGMLHSMGICYCEIGLLDHAAVPLRAALKIFQASPGDPRLPAVLLTLGNSLRKKFPAEAEAAYKEASELLAARLQYQSATSAWVNLGILYSEQGRFAESLELYERVLHVREQTAGTPPARIAVVLNNIANCYRRMGKFPEAHASVKRAIQLFPAEDAGLASTYGTQGMIFLDSGDDAHAVEWLRKASAERRKRPSPNLDATVENLESEIAALNRLHRENEVAVAQEKLATVRSTIQAIPKVDHGLSAVKAQMEGAVFVEITIGGRSVRSNARKNMTFLAERLSAEVRAKEAGFYSGWVAIPENTTLIFYGPEAEVLFKILEPSLTSEPLCAGARVLIRQGATHREVVVVRQSKTLN
jgi:tetratricopeptide (TPR) repeat protein